MLTNKSNSRDVNAKKEGFKGDNIFHLKQKDDIQVLKINIVYKNMLTDM